jgi:hypothetical protein
MGSHFPVSQENSRGVELNRGAEVKPESAAKPDCETAERV